MRPDSTTLLPQSLLDKIKEKDAETQPSRPKNRTVINRKDSRKQEREAKKLRKAEHHDLRRRRVETTAETSRSSPFDKRRATNEVEPPKKKPKLSETTPPSPEPNTLPKSSMPKSSSKRLASVSKPKMPTLRVDNLVPPKDSAELAEEKQIAWLEAQLGLTKGRKNSKSRYGAEFADDGLDELLMDVDRILYTSAGPSTAPATSFQDSVGHDEKELSKHDSGELSEDGFSLPETEDPRSSEQGTNDSNDGREEEPGEMDEDAQIQSTPTASRYVPPHLRGSSDPTQEVQKLRRQMKGLLNRMTEQNIEGLLNEFLALYRDNRRNDVTSNLSSLIVEGISSHSSLLASYVTLHASLITGLYKVVGVDFAAHFVESCVTNYETYYRAIDPQAIPEEQDAAVQGKECMNLIVLIAELYNFQVISCVLVYDIVRELLDGNLNEVNVELLLKITRSSGPQLRLDDPLALKDIVQLVQSKVADKNSRSLSSRTRFMIETLTNLKNNKVKQASNQADDSASRLRKFVSGLSKKHHILAHEPLRISLEDLRSADKKGKWWLVGAAWGGDPLVDVKKDQETKSSLGEVENGLMKLARSQGMNTDVRRSIFVVLMSSDDYIDACERLGQLGLSEIQQREMIRVLVHCCGNEKSYNPYYTMVGQQLCRTSHSFQITLQYCLWDFLRDLGENEVGGAGMVNSLQGSLTSSDSKSISATKIRNIAHAYAWWVAKGCTSLTILKAVDFASLQPQGQAFFNVFFSQLFLCSQISSPVHSFASSSPDAVPAAKDRKLVENLFLKSATQNTTLAQGMYRFISRGHLEKMAKTEAMSRLIQWASEVAKETIKAGIDIL